MIELIAQAFTFKLVDFFDVLFSCILIYFIYKLLRGTNALGIVFSFIGIYILWIIVSLLRMEILTKILGQFISVGAIGIIIIFQPEIRRFFAMVGSKSMKRGYKKFFFWKINKDDKDKLNSTAIVQAYQHLSQSKTGALIVIARHNDLDTIINTGEVLECKINTQLIETIFYKNTPLHDGAMIIKDNMIKAARCILPVSSNFNIPPHLGLRHRSAIGISEQTDAIAIIVSEQTGQISIAKAGNLQEGITPTKLQEFLNQEFNS
ncbi:MAG: diadenylate cyclase CdaA [Bacteroidales bacterium]|jgi:uncharacterized protein (TIGR00159 family)|nr:diadenylate cyclase CdaA [Bacteroidales bacterium]MDD4703065.1 diadenylate cyclase CdaA [Bacteroidales bacterium]MDX9797601.1 diadenylate cyclase CdaA [Bacteroidales bacterium]